MSMLSPSDCPPPKLCFASIQDALLANALSASSSGAALDSFLAKAINTANTTVYDRAIDSVYLTGHTGGSHLHHLLDGQHDLVGAFAAAHAALPHDSVAGEIVGTAHHLAKDLFSVMGLPVVSIHPEAYHRSADWIQHHLGISKLWQADLLQMNGMELLGGSLAGAALVMGARRQDSGALLEIAGSSGLAGILAANPIAMVAAAAALWLAWRGGPSGEVPVPGWHRLGTGAAGTSATAAVGSLLGGVAATGALPLAASLMLSLVAGIMVRRWLLARLPRQEPIARAEPERSNEKWRQHVIISSRQLHHSLDEPALALLQKAISQPT